MSSNIVLNLMKFFFSSAMFFQEVDIKSLPRAERRHVEEFLKMSETRAVAMKKLNYKVSS